MNAPGVIPSILKHCFFSLPNHARRAVLWGTSLGYQRVNVLVTLVTCWSHCQDVTPRSVGRLDYTFWHHTETDLKTASWGGLYAFVTFVAFWVGDVLWASHYIYLPPQTTLQPLRSGKFWFYAKWDLSHRAVTVNEYPVSQQLRSSNALHRKKHKVLLVLLFCSKSLPPVLWMKFPWPF